MLCKFISLYVLMQRCVFTQNKREGGCLDKLKILQVAIPLYVYKARDIAVNNNDAKYLINIFKEIVDKNKTTKNIDFTR